MTFTKRLLPKGIRTLAHTLLRNHVYSGEEVLGTIPSTPKCCHMCCPTTVTFDEFPRYRDIIHGTLHCSLWYKACEGLLVTDEGFHCWFGAFSEIISG